MSPAVAEYPYDDELIEAAAGGVAGVRVYRLAEIAVVLGRGSRPEVELNLEACLEDGVSLMRRRGGGCAVVVDPGNVIVSAAVPQAGLRCDRGLLDHLSEWLRAGLAAVGIAAVERDGICDLAIGGRKISGACLYRRRDLFYYSATLLVDADLGRIARYLAHPPREPAYRRGRPHQDFLGHIAAQGLTPAGLEALLGSVLTPVSIPTALLPPVR